MQQFVTFISKYGYREKDDPY